MKLQKMLIYGLLGGALAACDSIDENNRLIGPIEFETQKNILIEDFTGQTCVNCPNAASTIHSLQEMYGKSHVIAVAIHGGFMSIPAPAGLATEEGEAYVSHWGVEAFPIGQIDRTGGLTEYPSWSATAVKRLPMMTSIQISVENSYDKPSRKLDIHTVIDSEKDYNGKLQLWLIEDHIIAYQTIPPGRPEPKYEHNHVFRKAINGLWGEDIQLIADKSTDMNHFITLDEKWIPENVSVVAFVYNDEGVQQTIIESAWKQQEYY